MSRFGCDFNSDERLQRHASHKRDVIVYNEELDSKFCIYFPGDYREEYRILTHFYAYIYWADPHEERIYKRSEFILPNLFSSSLVRDRLHYIDSIFCGAGRAVQVLHEESFNLMPNKSISTCGRRSSLIKFPASTPSSPAIITCQDSVTLGGNVHVGPTYHAVHIRRGDFQYKHTRLTADRVDDPTDSHNFPQIWQNIKHLLNTSVTRILYIATDERDKSFFAPFHESFNVRFLQVLLSEIFRSLCTPGYCSKGRLD